MTRRFMVAGNWKMNTSLQAATDLASQVSQHNASTVDVVLVPPFPWLVPVGDVVRTSTVEVGAQNCHWESSGAFTGEVSATMLAEVCTFILAGHSERRHVFGESDNIVAKKLRAILQAGAAPILCVGETLDERRGGAAESTVVRQLSTAFAAVDEPDLASLVVAYEPVWAIGTGVAATAADAQEMCSMVRGWLTERYGATGQAVRILYGGSMTVDNAPELLAERDVDGGLVGGASLKHESFLGIIAAAESLATV